MSTHKHPSDSWRTASGAHFEELLPPGLQINPILVASAPTDRKLSLSVTILLSVALFGGGVYVAELSQREYLRTLKDQRQTVRLLLQEDFQLNDALGSGGGRSAQNHDDRIQTDHSLNPSMAPLNPIAYRTDPPPELLDPTVPNETPKELPVLTPGVQMPIIPSGGAGNGIGSGMGSGIGNGVGNGIGRGRGSTWIHSASGGEGILVPENFMDVKDYIPPEYPEAARLANVSGDVVIEVTIDEAGKPIKWTVLEGHPCLVAASLNVFPRWRFAPVRYQGQKVNATFEVRIRFTLI